ncbi:MAG: hypothetical protein NC913_05070, partial [Candidatus Omnitrophica bacterium]|nr:hypothetical protein [Candidatus Omnitrophota bacterium]
MEPAKLAKFSAVCLLAFLIFFSSEHLNAHNKISVVPVSKKVIVDGKLDEWDLSGMIEGAFEEALKPKFTFRIAMMYDTDALYIGAHFVDDTPMVNNHDPRVRPQDGWSGDALQIRLCNDPRAQYPLPTGTMKDFDTGTVVHMTMWYYTEEKLPVLFIQYGIHQEGYRGGSKVWTGLESGVVFQKDNDGYTLEARIPWDRLNIKEPLKAGDRIAMTIQPFWGDTSGTRHLITFNELVLGKGFAFKQPEIWGQAIFLATSALPGTDNRGSILSDKPLQDSLILNFPLPDNKAKYFVVGIYNKEGLLLRSLPPVFLDKLKGEETVKVEWDGLDDNGRPLSPGDYKAKIITTSGINLRYVTSIHNAGNPPWRTDDGTGSWGGDHGPPIAAACDSKRVYLGWELSEAGTAIIAVDPHLPSGRGIATRIGRKLWGQRQIRWSTISAMAADDKNLFVAQGNVVTIFSGASGKPLNFPFGSSQLIISEAKDLSKKWAEVYKKPFWERIKNNDFGPQVTGLNLLGIAVKGDILYASLFLEDKIAIYNWKTSKKVSEINVPAPAGVAIDNNGNLIVASQNKILNIKPETKDIKVLVAKDLSAPWGVAVDRSGNIYVTDCGNSMQVKIFNREGRLLGTIGKKGGRPWVGEYDATGMLMPSGITVDNEGKIWVCEYDDTPRRVSVWSLEGNLLADLLGPGAYAVGAEADEIAPQLVNLHHTLFKVDYKTGEVTPLSTLIRPRMRGFDMFSSRGFMGSALQFRHFKGQTFAMSRGRDGVVIYKINSELIAQPVFAMGCGSFEQLNRFLIRGDPAPEDVQAQFKKASGNQLFSYWWADLNNDGLIQGKELVIKKVDSTWGLTWGSWGGWLDTDMAVWNAGSGYIWRIPVKQWLFESIPVYQDFDEQRPLFQVPGRVHSVMPDGDKVLVIHHIGGNA